MCLGRERCASGVRGMRVAVVLEINKTSPKREIDDEGRNQAQGRNDAKTRRRKAAKQNRRDGARKRRRDSVIAR